MLYICNFSLFDIKKVMCFLIEYFRNLYDYVVFEYDFMI